MPVAPLRYVEVKYDPTKESGVHHVGNAVGCSVGNGVGTKDGSGVDVVVRRRRDFLGAKLPLAISLLFVVAAMIGTPV